MTYAIEAVALTKRFGRTQALDGVDLAVPQGSVLGVLGPNGAGKTTEVRILATLLATDSGVARVGWFDVRREASKVRRLIGLTGQYAAVDEDLTGTQNLVLIGLVGRSISASSWASSRDPGVLGGHLEGSERADAHAPTIPGGLSCAGTIDMGSE